MKFTEKEVVRFEKKWLNLFYIQWLNTIILFALKVELFYEASARPFFMRNSIAI